MPWIIYCHTHVETGRRYIGQTRQTAAHRWAQHVWEAMRRGHPYATFLDALRRFGPEAFSHATLETCATAREANEAERAWIGAFTTTDPRFGFNRLPGGQGLWTRDEMWLAAASHRQRALWQDPVFAAKMAAARTPEWKARCAGRGKSKKQDATSCKHGHPWPENRVALPQGKRMPGSVRFRCRACGIATWHARNPPHPRPVRTHCRFGHEFTPENTRSRASSQGAKICKECERAKYRRQVALSGGPSAPL